MARHDTIYALSSGSLPSGVAVVRISGAATKSALEVLAGALPRPREAELRSIRSRNGETLDRGLVLYFPSPASFTGEDCAELHLHGGRAVVNSVLAELSNIPGMRPAEAGEFTHRAFLNGKVDLTKAEALADLVSAETEAQRRFAYLNSRGRQAELYEDWRNRLLHIRAMLEAELDFSDQEDVPGSVADSVWTAIRSLQKEIDRHIEGYGAAEIIRDGLRVVILGAPNAGKSSLLNALAKRDVAIVSDEAGTTRDLIEVALDIDGYKVVLIDTAGLRDNAGKVEKLGIDRAWSAAREADLILALYDDEELPMPRIGELASPLITVGSKADLVQRAGTGNFDITLSSVSGGGVQKLIDEVGKRAKEKAAQTMNVVPSRQRHVMLLSQASTHLKKASAENVALELRAEELRLAGDSLGKITGSIDVEELLGAIFSEFCVGK